MSIREQCIDKGAEALFASGDFSSQRDARAASAIIYEIFVLTLLAGIVIGAVGMLLVGILYNAVFAQ
jgi:hypothetical protein